MNKSALVQKIIAHLAGELEAYARSAREAHAEATDEQNKAENKYDTRGLEAAYLARGQSRQAADVEQAIQLFALLELRDFGPGDGIDLGALVEVEAHAERSLYFIGPRTGGAEIFHDDKTVLVITPQSPLGQQLLGRKQGECWQVAIAGRSENFRVLSVS